MALTWEARQFFQDGMGSKGRADILAQLEKVAVTAGTAEVSHSLVLDANAAITSGMSTLILDKIASGTADNLRVGAMASVLDGSGSVLSSTRTASARFYADDGGTALGVTIGLSVPDIRNVLSRVLVTESAAAANNLRLSAVMGHIKAYSVTGDLGIWNNEQVASVYGFMELERVSGTATYGGYGVSAAVLGCIATTGVITVNTTHVFAGLAAISKLTSDLVHTGKTCGVYVGKYDTTNWSSAVARVGWGIGLYIPTGAIGGATVNANAAAIQVGDFAAAAAAGSGIVFSSVYTGLVKVYGESTSNLTSAVNARCGVFRHLITASCAHETYGLIGQVVAKSSTLSHLHAGLMGTFEVNTAATVPAGDAIGAAGVMSRIGGATITVGSTGMLAGVLSTQNATVVTITSGGVHAAFACRKVGSGVTWAEALHIEDALVAIRFKAADNSYAHGVKALAKKLDSANTTHCIKIMVGTTAAYIPAWVQEWNT